MKLHPKRLLSLLLAALLVLTALPSPAQAEEACPNHPTHDKTCSYTPAANCTHTHDESCGYTAETPCDKACTATDPSGAVVHAEDCAYRAPKACTHVHDETCNYQEGTPCTHECETCKPQEEHTHTYTYTDNADGTHTAACDCGETQQEPHAYTDGTCVCGASQPTPAKLTAAPRAGGSISAIPSYVDLPTTGTAAPASLDSSIGATPYYFTNRPLNAESGNMIFSYTGSDALSYEAIFTAPTDVTNWGTVDFNATSSYYFAYTPSPDVANKTVEFKIKATAGSATATTEHIWTINVGPVPNPNASHDATLKTLTYQVTGGTSVEIPLVDGQTDYTVTLNDADYNKTVTLSGTPNDTNATVSGPATTEATYWPTSATITVTAEDKSTTKTYAVNFSIPQQDYTPGVNVTKVSDSQNVTPRNGIYYVTPGERYQVVVNCGGGVSGYGAYSIAPNVTTFGIQSGINNYPNRYGALGFNLNQDQEITVSVQFYKDRIVQTGTTGAYPPGEHGVNLTIIAKTFVAEVTANGTTTPYTDFAAAWEAACNAGTPATITLCSNVTLTKSLRMPQGNVTLVGGGYTITSPENVSPIYIDGGTFTLESGTILAPGDHNDAISIDNPDADVTVTVNGGTLTGGNTSGGGLFAGKIQSKNVSVNINGGTFSGSYGAKLVDCTKAEIKGGTFSGTKNGLDVTFTGTGHTVTISGGTFSSIQNATANGTVKDLLAPGFTFYSGDAELDTSKPTLIPPTGQTLSPETRRPFDMDFTDATGDEGDLDRDGYHWDNTNKTLTLKDFTYTGDIIFPDQEYITVVTQSPSTLKGNIKFAENYGFHVTFTGESPLTVTGKIGQAGQAGSTVTVAQGANVTALGGVEACMSGSTNGTVTVNGTLTANSADDGYGGYSDAVSTGKVVIGPSGHLTVKGPNGVAVHGMDSDFAGAFTIQPGGKFTGECANYHVACFSPSGDLQGYTPEQIFVLPDHYLPNGWTKQLADQGAAAIAPVGATLLDKNGQLVGAGGAPLILTQHYPHTVSVTITGQGTVDVSAKTKLRDEKSFYESETVALTATPAKGYHLDSLTATQNGSTVTLTSEGSGAYTFEMPDADVTVTAVFLADPKPSDPSDPSDPDPSKPENPTNPSKPENPTKPSKPENPTKPETNPTKPETKPETKPTKPTTPAKPGKTPGTGDTSNILFWTILMLLTFTTAATLLFQTRRPHKRSKK